jgi:hypothetical protein
MDARKASLLSDLETAKIYLAQGHKRKLGGEYKFEKLKDIGFTNRNMKDIIIPALQNFGDMVDSLVVDLSGNEFDDASVKDIVEWFRLGDLPKKFTLNLSNNRFSPLGNECIRAAAKRYGKEDWRVETSGNLLLALPAGTASPGPQGKFGSTLKDSLKALLSDLQNPAPKLVDALTA